MPPRVCSVEGHFNPLKSYLFYVGYGRGDDFRRYRLRFCRAHLDLVQKDLSENEVSPDSGALSGGKAAEANCLSCGKPLDETGWQFFATCSPTQNERKDSWANIPVECSLPQPLVQGQYAE